jgi:rRNA-processing protein FCF1
MYTTRQRPIVVLDTNMLLLMADGVPVLDNIREQLETEPLFVVIKPVYDELIRLLMEGESKVRKKAKFALEIVNTFCTIVDYPRREGESVDDAIIRYAQENKAIVATSDRELRRKLRAHGIPSAYLREESMRVIVEHYF